jgi:ubiquitin-conjugating enzyme E2 variant
MRTGQRSVIPPMSGAPLRRVFECLAIFVASALWATTAYLALKTSHSGALWTPLGFVLVGLIASDAISGTVHWLADSYGTPTMPVFGAFVRTFREHHADPKAITRHDWIETNGDVCLFSAPVHASALIWVDDPWVLSWMTGLFMGSYSNSQIHKWAHSDVPPKVIRCLQRAGAMLSSSHHRQHHRGPHMTHYCITTGWANAALDHVRFFRILERALAACGIVANNRTSDSDSEPVPLAPSSPARAAFEGRAE